MNFKDMVNKRRSVNFFDPKRDITTEQVHEILELASRAPSSFNLQPWQVMVLRDHDEKLKLQKLAWDQPKVSEAPVTLIVLADRSGFEPENPFFEKNWDEMLASGSMVPEQREWFLGATQSLYGRGDDSRLAFAVKNTAFFAMGLMFAATSLGLDTHPMDGFDHDAVKKAFQIPDYFWIPLLLSIGYAKPGLELHAPKWRKTAEEMIVKF